MSAFFYYAINFLRNAMGADYYRSFWCFFYIFRSFKNFNTTSCEVIYNFFIMNDRTVCVYIAVAGMLIYHVNCPFYAEAKACTSGRCYSHPNHSFIASRYALIIAAVTWLISISDESISTASSACLSGATSLCMSL